MGFAQAGNLASLLAEHINVKGKIISTNLTILSLIFMILLHCYLLT
jgi:hypothetical protein